MLKVLFKDIEPSEEFSRAPFSFFDSIKIVSVEVILFRDILNQPKQGKGDSLRVIHPTIRGVNERS